MSIKHLRIFLGCLNIIVKFNKKMSLFKNKKTPTIEKIKIHI